MSDSRHALLKLCQCLRGHLPESPDWTSLLSLANQSLTTPALRDFAKEHQRHIPGDVTEYIERMFSSNERRNRKLVEQTIDAVATLNDVDVRPALLKGAGRLVTISDDRLGARITWDLDILVAPEHATRSVEALQRSGYSVYSQAADAAAHWFVNLERPGEAAHIDLHVHPPGHHYYQFSIGTLERHCDLVTRGKAAALVPRPTFHAMILIIHDQLHDADYLLGRLSLLHLLDICELSRSPDGLDWDLLGSYFSDAFMRNALETQLVALWELLRLDVPIKMRRRLMPRLQHWRRLQQMARPGLKDALLAGTLLLEIPTFLAHRAHAQGANPSNGRRPRKRDVALGWSRFQFLRGLAGTQKLGKLQ
jgi:hypothetical protein